MKRNDFIQLILLVLLPVLGFSQNNGKEIDLSKDKKEKTVPIKVYPNGQIKTTGRSNARQVWIEPEHNNTLIIEWISPKTQNVEGAQDKVQIKLIIKSSIPIEKKDINIYINGQKSGSKFEEGGLFGDTETFFYENTIKISDRDQKVEVEVSNKAGTKRSKPLLIKGKSTEKTAPAEQLWTYWVSPNRSALQGKPLVQQVSELAIDLNIHTQTPIEKQNITVFLNGKMQNPTDNAVLTGYDGDYNFKDFIQLEKNLPFNEIYLKVESKAGSTFSKPLLIKYDPLRPNLHLLAIGPQLDLDYTEKDARDFAALFDHQSKTAGARLFNSVEKTILTGNSAKTLDIAHAITQLGVKIKTGNIGQNDLVVLFISSHGFISDSGDFRLQGNDFSRNNVNFTSLSYKNDLLPVLNQLPCKKVVFIDACHSGPQGVKDNSFNRKLNEAIRQINLQKEGLAVITSSRENEQSYEDDQWKNGAFTEAIISGLKNGKADHNGNRIITVNELYNYIGEEVPNMVQKVKNKPQHPNMISNGLGNIAIYILPN